MKFAEMKNTKHGQGLMACAACMIVASTSPAYAYLDPGTASIILQAIIGGVAAAFVTISMHYQRLKMWISKRFNRVSDSSQLEGETQDDES